MKKAIFLDRDGVLNVDYGYVSEIEKCDLVDENQKIVLQKLRDEGFLLIIFTNQSGIGRGFYSEKEFFNFNKKLEEKLDLKFDKIYFCSHLKEDNCNCRKPKIGMFENFSEDFKSLNIDLENSFMIGDKISDMEFGKNFGVGKKIFFGDEKIFSDKEKIFDFSVKNWNDIGKIIFK